MRHIIDKLTICQITYDLYYKNISTMMLTFIKMVVIICFPGISSLIVFPEREGHDVVGHGLTSQPGH